MHGRVGAAAVGTGCGRATGGVGSDTGSVLEYTAVATAVLAGTDGSVLAAGRSLKTISGGSSMLIPGALSIVGTLSTVDVAGAAVGKGALETDAVTVNSSVVALSAAVLTAVIDGAGNPGSVTDSVVGRVTVELTGAIVTAGVG